MERRLLYSERKRLNETGSLGDLGDFPSMELRNALAALVRRLQRTALLPFPGSPPTSFQSDLRQTCQEYLGLATDVDPADYPLLAPGAEELLDFCEIVVRVERQHA